MKRSHVIVLCLCVVLCVFSGVMVFRDAGAAQSSQAATTPVHIERETLTLEQGGVKILPETANSETDKLTQWSSSNAKTAIVDDGGRIDALKQGKTTVTAVYPNGDTYTCEVTVSPAPKEEELDTFSTAITDNLDIAKKNVENYASGASKLRPYRLHVNRSQNCVTAYTYGEDEKYTVPVRAMVCSVGINNTTVTGIYSIGFHSEWYPLTGDVIGQYASAIVDDVMFHSVPYTTYTKDSLESKEYNKLGEAASKGCIRMAVSDVKWITDNCEIGTVVFLFDNNDSPGPLGKPEPMRIADTGILWDPTDNVTDNPYNNKKPQISGAKSITITAGDAYDMKSGVTATDSCGNDVTAKMDITGNVKPDVPGTYRVSYRVTDALHRTASSDVIITVEKPKTTEA